VSTADVQALLKTTQLLLWPIHGLLYKDPNRTSLNLPYTIWKH